MRTSFPPFDNHLHVQPLTLFCKLYFRKANSFSFWTTNILGNPKIRSYPSLICYSCWTFNRSLYISGDLFTKEQRRFRIVDTLSWIFPITRYDFHDFIAFKGLRLAEEHAVISKGVSARNTHPCFFALALCMIKNANECLCAYKGSPWRSPLVRSVFPFGWPLNKTWYFTNMTHCIIRLIHMFDNLIFHDTNKLSFQAIVLKCNEIIFVSLVIFVSRSAPERTWNLSWAVDTLRYMMMYLSIRPV